VTEHQEGTKGTVYGSSSTKLLSIHSSTQLVLEVAGKRWVRSGGELPSVDRETYSVSSYEPGPWEKHLKELEVRAGAHRASQQRSAEAQQAEADRETVRRIEELKAKLKRPHESVLPQLGSSPRRALS